MYIFANRARASHRRCQLSSNVRQRTTMHPLLLLRTQDTVAVKHCRCAAHGAAWARSRPVCVIQLRPRLLGCSASNEKDKGPQYRIEPPHCVGGSAVQSVRGAAAPGVAALVLAYVGPRLKCVACHGCQRGAGGTCSGPGNIARPWQAQRRHASGATLPNPSLKLSPNGGPRRPGRRYAVHFRQPGPRVPPSVPP